MEHRRSRIWAFEIPLTPLRSVSELHHNNPSTSTCRVLVIYFHYLFIYLTTL
jgi:hypothetical protein